MPGEKDTIFSSKIKYSGIFKFSEFYKFSYDWLTEEFGLAVVEEQYIEKIKGTSKDIEFKWTGTKEVTDYFKFEVKVKFKILGMEDVEVVQDKVKTKMNKGGIEVKISSTLLRDYKGKFEASFFQKFVRGIYEKWVIPSRISQYEDKLVGKSDEFLSQLKAYLDLEGKR
jgi:hypothetical protein